MVPATAALLPERDVDVDSTFLGRLPATIPAERNRYNPSNARTGGIAGIEEGPRGMERSDRIALTVATVLVVALLSGSGFLVWKRVDTLASERPLAAEGPVTLAPLQADETATATPAKAKPARKPGPPRQPKGSELGIISSVRKSGSTYYLTYDPAALLLGKEADIYAKSKGRLAATGGFTVANDTHRFKRLPLSKRVKIVTAGSNDSGAATTLTAPALVKAYGASGDSDMKQSTWWVFAKDGVVLRLQQTGLE